jgi:hypothetical protein
MYKSFFCGWDRPQHIAPHTHKTKTKTIIKIRNPKE